ncbi:hypothetical protein H0O02_00500 [Candidatus Micrarchaeota archaeon]|nr:hypothetical protein [Candidatus Micrarchaeota archaeon]
MEKTISKRGIVFLLLFTALALVGMQFNFSKVIGMDNQTFTFFQFFGPIAGGFLGAFGIVAVLFAQLINFVISGKETTLVNILRLTPMLFAAYYFSKNRQTGFSDKLSIAIPLAAMLIFWTNPAGLGAWYYALFWTIPIIAKFLPDMLVLRSLGATFTAHAIGSSIWVLTVPMTAAQWAMLVPVTATERLLFAAGIAVSYVVFTNILNMADKAWDITKFVNIDQRYVLSPMPAKAKKE